MPDRERKNYVDSKEIRRYFVVANKERIFNVAKDVSKNIKKEMTWWSFFPQWENIRMS